VHVTGKINERVSLSFITKSRQMPQQEMNLEARSWLSLYNCHTLLCIRQPFSNVTIRLPKVIWEQAPSQLLVVDPLTATAYNQLYLPGGTNVHAHVIHEFLGSPHSPSLSAARPVRPFLHADATFILCYVEPTNFPEKFVSYLIHRSSGSPPQTVYWSSQSFFPKYTVVRIELRRNCIWSVYTI